MKGKNYSTNNTGKRKRKINNKQFMNYNDILEQIIDYQAALSKALLNFDYANIEFYSAKIGKLIVRILNENKIIVKK